MSATPQRSAENELPIGHDREPSGSPELIAETHLDDNSDGVRPDIDPNRP